MGRTPSLTSDGLKKGVWTAEEDQKLISYVQKHGEGGWRSLPYKAGLQRCGRSCRLRWTNYLKPGIRRGDFTPEEDQTIIKLHAQLGNRWATIARHFSGRTDHEIKNHWHAHLKKRLLTTDIHPTITSSSLSSGNSDSTAVIAVDPKTDTECSKPQQSEPKQQRSTSALLLNKLATRIIQSTSALLLNKLATRITQCVGPLQAPQTPETSYKDVTDSFTTSESRNDIIASKFSSLSYADELNEAQSNNNNNIVTREIQVDNYSDSTTVDYYEGLWDHDVIVDDDDHHMNFDTLGFYDSNLFSP